MLTQESQAKLWKLFEFRKVPYRGKKNIVRKYAIPIGVNELVIRKVEEGSTRNGKRMVVLTLWKPPDEAPYNFCVKEPLSFAPIVTRHIEGHGGVGTFYKPFSAMNTEALDQLLTFKKKRFNAVVKHVQKELVKDGQVVRNPDGKKVVFWSQEIVSVHPVDVIPKVDYFSLVEYVENDIRVTDEFIKFLNYGT